MKALLHSLSPHTLRRRGFTILELLVAITLLSILVVLLLSMLDNTTKLWRTNENRVESYREARAALNLIASDLRSIYSSTNTNAYASTFPNFDSTNSLGFLANLPLSAQGGSNKSELCTVAYFSGFGKAGAFNTSTQQSGNVYRFLVPSDDTFVKMTNTPPDFFANTLASGNISPTATGLDVIARNIADFSVREYTVATNGSLSAFTQSTNTPLPDLIEVSITAVNNEYANRVGALDKSTWENTMNSTNAIGNTRTFTVRIPIPRPN